jgi:hypothetical protein
MPRSFSEIYSIADYVSAAPALQQTAVTAGGAGDNVEVNGLVFDRQSQELARSCALVVYGVATLAANQRLEISANLQDDTAAAFTATPTDLEGTLVNKVALQAGGTPLTNAPWSVRLDVNLNPARRYVRAQITPNLSASGTDTAQVNAVMVLGGQQQLPVA